jgi:hypothetical protein
MSMRIAFLVATVGVGVAIAGVFWLLFFLTAVYVFENNRLILYTEMLFSTSFAIWAVLELVKAAKRE